MNRYPALAAVLTMLAAAPALAEQQADHGVQTVELRVEARDLDLTTEAGAETFLDRLSRAARRACGGRPDPGVDLIEKSQAFRACAAAALKKAVADSGSARVRERYAVRTGAGDLQLVHR